LVVNGYIKQSLLQKDRLKNIKARLVAKGFSQQEGIDYNETFAPVAKMNTIRTIISLVASYQWELHQMDVKSVFLNGDLHEDIYMQQPPGFITTETSSLVCKLNKSLYGLKQAPRAWYEKIDTYFLKNGFKRCISDPNLYVKNFGDEFLIVVLYVDDLIITGSQLASIQELKNNLKNQFEMTDFRHLALFSGSSDLAYVQWYISFTA
jgi:hypothetical protein